MEIPLQSQRLVFCRQNAHFHFRPFSGLFSFKPSPTSSLSYSCHLKYPGNGIFRPISAAGGFSRKKSRRWSTSRSKDPAPKGFVPKAPVGTSSQKKGHKNEEDDITSINPNPGLGRKSSDVGPSTQVNIIEERKENASGTNTEVEDLLPKKKIVYVSGINLLKEPQNARGFLEEDASGTKRKVEEPLPTMKAVYVSSINLLKEPESNKGFIEEGKSSSSTINSEARLESVHLESDKEYSETKVLETSDNCEKEADDSENYEDNLVSMSQRCYTIASGEMESEGVDIVQEKPVMINYQSIEAENFGTETDVLTLETMVSDITPYERKVKDIVIVRENLSLMNSQKIESDKNVSLTGDLRSETSSDTISSYENEVGDFVQENVANETNVTAPEELESDIKEAIDSGELEVGDREDSGTRVIAISDTCEKEADDFEKYEDNLVSVNQHCHTIASGEMESECVDVVQEMPVMINHQSIEAENFGTDTDVLTLETMISDITPYYRKVKDIIILRENLSLMNSQNIEFDKNVSLTGDLRSETSSDTISNYEKEVRDFIQENVANETNVTAPEELESDIKEAIDSDELDVGDRENSETRVLKISDNFEKEADDSEEYENNLVSVNQHCHTIASGEMESEGVDVAQEKPVMITYQSTEAERFGTETDVLTMETRVSDITPYVRKVKDIVIVRESLSLVNYENIESDTNVTLTGDLNSETSSGTISNYENEVGDFIQENVANETNVTGTEELESDLKEAIDSDKLDVGESLRKLEMEMEEQELLRRLEIEKEEQESLRKLELEMEALMRKQAIEQLAEMNFSRGNKMFIYPEIVKPDEDIEVFLNRTLSTLKNEPDVMIMGAFNDWRWKSFTVKLDKSHFIGDWWSCRIRVPREAYILDFVFYNGKDVYENNNMKDFHVTVKGGMDTFAFEDFLLEDKRREVEKLAKIQAERKRQVEEQKQIEEEKAATEADRSQAKVQVEQRREKLRALVKNATSSKENVWYFEPRNFQDGDLVQLFYNKSCGPLAQAHEIWVHGGHDGWVQGLSVVSKLVKSVDNADWWYAEVTVPDQAIVLDWVFANGPPQQASLYDNNNRQDFHAIVPKSMPDELYWVEEEQRIYQRLQQERRLREEAICAKAEKTARMKAEIKERTMKTFLLSQRHIVYTDPVDVKAGQDVTVYYNPSNTVLNGKPEVWFRGSFNRWTHRRGPLSPQKMLPAENGFHVKTTVKVPLDAYMLDFVFSEKEDGGIFDNKSGMDYHVPVAGGVASEPPMHIVHIAVEMAPIAKVGGLGDVVTSLARAVQELNHHVYIVLPKYDCVNPNQVKDLHYQRSYPWGGIEIKVWAGKVEGLSVYFLDPQNGLFRTNSVYIGRNDGERFGFFCHAALEFLLQSGFHPDIIHCHDWTSAPVAWLYKENYGQYGLTNARVVFTIHNLEFGAYFIGRAMAYADKATTVSNTYSKEVARNPAIAPHLGKFHGILNGIDPDIWDPYNDKFIPVQYTSENVVDGKRAAKEALQQRFNLKKGDFPIMGIITRLTHQKGIHLIKHAIWRTIERGGQVVLLGTAPDPRIQQEFVDLGNQLHNMHHDRGRLCLTYDEPLSHLIYAGADFILVPSIFEPCGLTQLVAMRYGSVPVVRKTGGLYDTVFDVDHDIERAKAQGLEPNGFTFEGADQAGVDYAVNRALTCWYDGKEWLNSLRKRVMEQDWSWNRPALEYMELYHAARKY